MANIKKTIYKEAKKIASKTELDITAEELASLALFKFLNLPYFNNVHDFIKMNYNIFDEISIVVNPLNNVKGYSNETVNDFIVQMDKADKYSEMVDISTQILNERDYKTFKSFVDIANSSKNLKEMIQKIEKEESTDPFYTNKIMNMMNTYSYSGNRLIRAVDTGLDYKESDTYTEYRFEQSSKTKHYRGRSQGNELKDFVYEHYTLRDLSGKSFDAILETTNPRDIEALTGVSSLTNKDLKGFHNTHPHEYKKSILKVFKDHPDSLSRCQATFDLNHFDKEVQVLNNRYKRLIENPTCEELYSKYDAYIQPIMQIISKVYPQITKSVEDSDYEITRFTHTTFKQREVFIKKEHTLEIFQSDRSCLDYQSIRGLLFFKSDYPAEKGLYIAANNGLEDIAGAEGYFMDTLSFSSSRIKLPNIRISRVFEAGRDIDISIKKAILENGVKLAAESKSPFVYDIIERDHKGQDKLNNQMKLCIQQLKQEYPNVIFFNDCIMLSEKDYLESSMKVTLLLKLSQLNSSYETMITANKEVEKYFKTSEFNEIAQQDYKVRSNNKEIDSKIESIVSAVSATKNKIKFTP